MATYTIAREWMGRISESDHFAFADDETAIGYAARAAAGGSVQLWRDDRLVTCFEERRDAPEALTSPSGA